MNELTDQTLFLLVLSFCFVAVSLIALIYSLLFQAIKKSFAAWILLLNIGTIIMNLNTLGVI